MKRMFSEEEIAKIAEAAGVSPEKVKEILDGALMSDDTTKALVDDIIYNYLELNPPALYTHALRLERSGDPYAITFTIISSKSEEMTVTDVKAFVASLGVATRFNANGYAPVNSNSNMGFVYAIGKGSSDRYMAAYSYSTSVGAGTHTVDLDNVTILNDTVKSA